MVKDYAHKYRKKSNKKSRNSSSKRQLNWLALILVAILLPTFIFSLSVIKKRYASQNSPPPSVEKTTPEKTTSQENVTASKPEKTTSQENVTASNTQQLPPIHFDFYQVLPNATLETLGEAKISNAQKEKSSEDYIIQIASFTKSKDAKKFQKKLKNMGFNAKIFTLRKNETKWYRIQMEPFTKKQSAQNIQSQLREKGINNLLISI
jgi:cell division protein FtsN